MEAKTEHAELLALQRIDEASTKLQKQGKYLEALECMERGLVLRQHFFGANSDEVWSACKTVGEMCNLLAMTYLQQEDFPMVLELLKKAEILSERDKRGKAVTFNNLACYYRRQGKLHASLTYLQKAVKIEQYLDDVENKADTHLNLCAVLSQLGRHAGALEHAQTALILLQEELFAKPTIDKTGETIAKADRIAVLSIAYHNIGVEQEFLRKYEMSIHSYQKGVEISEQYLGGQHGITITLRNSLLAAKRVLAKKLNSKVNLRANTQKVGGGSRKKKTSKKEKYSPTRKDEERWRTIQTAYGNIPGVPDIRAAPVPSLNTEKVFETVDGYGDIAEYHDDHMGDHAKNDDAGEFDAPSHDDEANLSSSVDANHIKEEDPPRMTSARANEETRLSDAQRDMITPRISAREHELQQEGKQDDASPDEELEGRTSSRSNTEGKLADEDGAAEPGPLEADASQLALMDEDETDQPCAPVHNDAVGGSVRELPGTTGNGAADVTQNAPEESKVPDEAKSADNDESKQSPESKTQENDDVSNEAKQSEEDEVGEPAQAEGAEAKVEDPPLEADEGKVQDEEEEEPAPPEEAKQPDAVEGKSPEAEDVRADMEAKTEEATAEDVPIEDDPTETKTASEDDNQDTDVAPGTDGRQLDVTERDDANEAETSEATNNPNASAVDLDTPESLHETPPSDEQDDPSIEQDDPSIEHDEQMGETSDSPEESPGVTCDDDDHPDVEDQGEQDESATSASQDEAVESADPVGEGIEQDSQEVVEDSNETLAGDDERQQAVADTEGKESA